MKTVYAFKGNVGELTHYLEKKTLLFIIITYLYLHYYLLSYSHIWNGLHD